MFCSKCGHQLDDDAIFCPKCGHNTGAAAQSTAYTKKPAHYKTSEKSNWKIENIERYAPLAALLPLCFYILNLVLSIFSAIPIIGYVFRLVSALVHTAFILAPLAATAGLVYVAIKKQVYGKIYTWLAPIATLTALPAIVVTNGTVVIFFIISLVLGLEAAARMTINQKPIDSPFNASDAVNTFKKLAKDNAAKNDNSRTNYNNTNHTTNTPNTDNTANVNYYNTNYAYNTYNTTVQYQAQPMPEVMGRSDFDGSGIELLGYYILAAIVSVCTLGIATPWMICKIYKWKISHTLIDGKRLTFTGTGGSLLGHWLLWEFLSIITLGIYSFFAHVALRKWEVSHTFIESEPILPNSTTSDFDGKSIQYFGYGLLNLILIMCTLTLAFPWTMSIIQKWDTKHQLINGKRLYFDGTGGGFLKEYIIIFLLTLVTLGIYYPWATIRMNKYIYRHTHFVI